jgi:hypothetical protein
MLYNTKWLATCIIQHEVRNVGFNPKDAMRHSRTTCHETLGNADSFSFSVTLSDENLHITTIIIIAVVIVIVVIIIVMGLDVSLPFT